MAESVLIVIPSYNERENIGPLVTRVLTNLPSVHMLIVDDSSPDGTGAVIRKISISEKRVGLLERSKKEGFGSACVAGLKWGLEKGYSLLIQMDADLSHPPEAIPSFTQKLGRYDVVIGSRYVPGGGVSGWPWYRLLLSRFGNHYARTILGLRLRDVTGGFNGWRREVLEQIELDSICSRGYAVLPELKYRALLAGASITEIPIIFQGRRYGKSKVSSSVIAESAVRVLKLRLAPH